MLIIQEVKNSREVRQFVDFPFKLYKGNKFWVPPLKRGEIKLLNPVTNPAYDFCDVKLWMALRGKKCVGRIAAIINYKYIEKTGEKLGRISRIEFIDDNTVSSELFITAEGWLKEMGMAKVHGPLGFTNFDHQGMLIEGFDHLPSVASVYHMSYYLKHIENAGYEKEADWLEFRLTLGEKAVKKGKRGAELIKKRYGFEVESFNTTDEMRPYIPKIFAALNEAFYDLPYVTEFNDRMVDLYSKEYLKVLKPSFVKVVKKDGKVAGFVIAMPSLSEAMQKAGGRLFPCGILPLMRALKKPKVIDLLLTGVLNEYQSSGVAVILFGELQDEMMKRGINQMETTGVFESNNAVISNWKNYVHIQHKRRRCFVKAL